MTINRLSCSYYNMIGSDSVIRLYDVGLAIDQKYDNVSDLLQSFVLSLSGHPMLNQNSLKA